MNKIEKWISKNIDGNVKNKNIFVTGSNSGIGLETCFYLASLKANIYMAIRNLEKGKVARDKILEKYPNAKIELLELDIASFESIDKFIESIKTIEIDVFIHNAGVYRIKNQVTKQNLEIVMGTNYIGTYYLNEKLMPYLKTMNHKVKIIFTGSIASYWGKLNYNDFFNENKSNKMMKKYSNSKLAISSYFVYLAKNNKDTNLEFLLFHPGITYTPLIKKAYKGKFFNFLASTFMKIFFHDAKKASLGLIYLLNENIKNNTYVGPRGFLNISGFPTKNKLTKKAYRNNDKLIEYTNYLLKNL